MWQRTSCPRLAGSTATLGLVLARLRHEMELSNWQLDPTAPADAFASSSATSATRIVFTRPDLKLPPGLKPPAPGKPSKAHRKGGVS